MTKKPTKDSAALKWIKAKDREHMAAQIIMLRISAQECELWAVVKALDEASKGYGEDMKRFPGDSRLLKEKKHASKN